MQATCTAAPIANADRETLPKNEKCAQATSARAEPWPSRVACFLDGLFFPFRRLIGLLYKQFLEDNNER